jgi:type III pantothenate kinase
MNLAVDLGNTQTKLAVFQANILIKEFVLDNLTTSFLSEIFDKFAIKKSIISSVVNCNPKVISFLRQNTLFTELTHSTATGLTINYHTPETLGSDRIAAAMGAISLYPSNNLLVCDLGSCNTMDLITADGVFEGGNIAPGFRMRIMAMHNYTTKLPIVESRFPENILGKTTTQAILNGAFWGVVAEIDQLFDTLHKQYHKISLILTGGDAHFFANQIKNCTFVIPNLVLLGLNTILNNTLKIK